jgi:hypothetical protein
MPNEDQNLSFINKKDVSVDLVSVSYAMFPECDLPSRVDATNGGLKIEYEGRVPWSACFLGARK